MAKREVITYGNPILRQVAAPIKKIDARIHEIVTDMMAALAEEEGIGLAAPQIGISERVVIIDLSKSGQTTKMTLINPEIIYMSKDSVPYEEGCLSVPEVWGTVYRPSKIRVKSKNLLGKTFIIEADEILARVLQHEIDHLNGKLFIDYLSEEDRQKNAEKIEKLIEENRKKLGNVAL
ncbi:peptide deformylase [Thermospira aquatica]|uniref:Peptide deformylase n=1 Tax=Thermospira aquatica TaxID=2828656 RepID=A0AAX3BG73_9SPIR|nr:peptide deformylase [Thermospira aquatica]URA11138.1 peptide deformylase [Thermospira aquatica]